MIDELPGEIIYHILEYCSSSALYGLGKTNLYIRSVYLTFMSDMGKQGIETVEEITRKPIKLYGYLKDQLHGPYIIYYTQYLTSKPWQIFHYFKGVLHGPVIGYYGSNRSEDIINSIEFYQDGVKSGPSYEYYSNGLPKKYEHYKNGLLDGLVVGWISTVDTIGINKRHYVSRKVRFKEGKRQGIEYRADYLSPDLKPFGAWKDDKLIHVNKSKYDPINRLTKRKRRRIYKTN